MSRRGGNRDGLRKDTDYETSFRCAGGYGILREEVWVDAEGNVVRYNLAFILPHAVAVDKGRVLGYDNAHGIHERHFMGGMQTVDFENYGKTAKRFYREAALLRAKYEDEGVL